MVAKIHAYVRNSIIVTFAMLLAVASVPLQKGTVSAYGCDEEFYSNNNILFYNPCAATACGTTLGTADIKDVQKLRGNGNGEKIFNFWLDAGLTAQQAAGVVSSLYEEGNFSPFRQEGAKTWPAGGWGIAQFTNDPGLRADAKAYVKKEVGDDLFTSYYKAEYGGPVYEKDGFIPKGVPDSVNEKFLLAQLNYLLEYTQANKPPRDRAAKLKSDFTIDIPADQTLFTFIKSLVNAEDVTAAWTYLYEWPRYVASTTKKRSATAADYLKLYGEGVKSTCGGNLVAGGMTLDQAQKFMETYKNSSDSIEFIGGAGQGCTGGPLANCVSFSVYFINKYTSLKGMGKGTTPGHGRAVTTNAIARNPNAKNGHSPQPYAVFSTSATNDWRGHTGVILGVDTTRKKVVVGEAACGYGIKGIVAKEYDLSKFDSDAYTYIYTDGFLKEDIN